MNPKEPSPGRSPEHPTASSTLLAGAREMDSAAWSRLVETFGPIVYRWCRSSGVTPIDASDVVQEVFASVARGIGDFERQKRTGSFRSWLATITRNRVRDHFRRQSRQEGAIGGTDAWQQLEQHPESLDSSISVATVENLINRRVLESVRGEFQPTTWTAFWMTTVEGRSSEEAAETTGLAPASVYQAKSRVLRRFRQRLAELPE